MSSAAEVELFRPCRSACCKTLALLKTRLLSNYVASKAAPQTGAV